MHKLNPRFSSLWLILVCLALSGCATKKYVKYQVGTVDTKVAAVETKVGELTTTVSDMNEKVEAANRRSEAAATSAAAAEQKAAGASQAAAGAERKADAANQGVQQANARMDTMEARLTASAGTELDKYTAGEPQRILFKVNSDVLDDKAKESLDTMASEVINQQAGYLVEVQGFTDSTGSDKYNTHLSQQRAESARRYLVTKGVPLYRIAVIGLGEESPVAANTDRSGREQNRRIEVRILRSATARTTNN